MTDKAYAVPLHEQLARVPRDARLVIDDADGMGTTFIPVGRYCHEAADALRAALAQPEQEPVAYLCENAVGHKYFRWKKPSSEYKPIALYTAHASPQRIWQGLTGAERIDIIDEEITAQSTEHFALAQAIEAKLKEKNT